MAYTHDDEIIYKALIWGLADLQHIYGEIWMDGVGRGDFDKEPSVLAAREAMEILKARREDPIDEEAIVADLKLEQARIFQPDDYRRMTQFRKDEAEKKRRRGGRPRKQPQAQEVS